MRRNGAAAPPQRVRPEASLGGSAGDARACTAGVTRAQQGGRTTGPAANERERGMSAGWARGRVMITGTM